MARALTGQRIQSNGARELRACVGRAVRPFYHHPYLSSPRLLTARQAHLQYYTEPSAEPLPARSSALQGKIFPLSPGTFTVNTAGVPIVVACTKADLIPTLSAGASGMDGMVRREECTGGIVQRTANHRLPYSFLTFMACRVTNGPSLFHTTRQPTTSNVPRQYALHDQFVP